MNHGVQCGFCTPGMVMSMYALLRSHPLPTVAQMERALEGGEYSTIVPYSISYNMK